MPNTECGADFRYTFPRVTANPATEGRIFGFQIKLTETDLISERMTPRPRKNLTDIEPIGLA